MSPDYESGVFTSLATGPWRTVAADRRVGFSRQAYVILHYLPRSRRPILLCPERFERSVFPVSGGRLFQVRPRARYARAESNSQSSPRQSDVVPLDHLRVMVSTLYCYSSQRGRFELPKVFRHTPGFQSGRIPNYRISASQAGADT